MAIGIVLIATDSELPMQVLGNATVIVQRFMVCTPFDKVEETMGRAQKDHGRKVTFKLPMKAVSTMKAVPSHVCERLAAGGSALGARRRMTGGRVVPLEETTRPSDRPFLS